jgi:hypothetical protein
MNETVNFIIFKIYITLFVFERSPSRDSRPNHPVTVEHDKHFLKRYFYLDAL